MLTKHGYRMNFSSFHKCSAYTVKPAHTVTSIKQSPVLKGHHFSCPVIYNFILIEPLLRSCLSYKTTFLCPKCDLLIQVRLHFTIYI